MSERPPEPTSSALISFDIVCDIAGMTSGTIHSLERLGFVHAKKACILIVMDAPYGFAMRYLASHRCTDRHVIVTTGNTSPEYCADLAELSPAILLVGPDLGRELLDALVRASRGERYHVLHALTSQLSTTQRKILRCAAAGQNDRQIAQHLGISAKTVRNILSQIYKELQCSSRTEAALMYWGIQYQLPDF